MEFHVILFWKRNQFFNENNKLKSTIVIYKEDSINTIKFVGYWHSSLTDTMRLINFCFSVSVNYMSLEDQLFLSYNNLISNIDAGYVQHCRGIFILRFNILLILSIHFDTNRFPQRDNSNSNSMAGLL